jgi:type IV secretion system protein VirB1
MTNVLNRRSCSIVFVAIAAVTTCVMSGLARAATLSTEDFSAMAARCAPAVAVRTLYAVALTESGLDPWALHDNNTGKSETPGTRDASLADARAWLGLGHSVDIGLMQVNSANLAALHMTILSALDPCVSMAGGAQVLRAAYGEGSTPADQQVALLLALSRYNTGSPLRGIMNGYVHRVMANADVGGAPLPAVGRDKPTQQSSDALTFDPDAPPAWNVAALGSYAQLHGAPWLISMPTTPPPLKAWPNHPALAPTTSTLVATNRPGASAQSSFRNPS